MTENTIDLTEQETLDKSASAWADEVLKSLSAEVLGARNATSYVYAMNQASKLLRQRAQHILREGLVLRGEAPDCVWTDESDELRDAIETIERSAEVLGADAGPGDYLKKAADYCRTALVMKEQQQRLNKVNELRRLAAAYMRPNGQTGRLPYDDPLVNLARLTVALDFALAATVDASESAEYGCALGDARYLLAEARDLLADKFDPDREARWSTMPAEVLDEVTQTFMEATDQYRETA